MNPLANLIHQGLVDAIVDEGEIVYQLTPEGQEVFDQKIRQYGHNPVEPN